VVPDSDISFHEKEILMLNRSTIAEPEIMKKNDSIYLINMMSRLSVDGFYEMMGASSIIDTQSVTRMEVQQFDTINTTTGIEKEELRRLTGNKLFDMIIVQDYLWIDFRKSYDIRTGVSLEGSFQEYFFAIISALSKATWSVFDGFTREKLLEFDYMDTLIWEEYGDSYSEASERLGDPIDIIREAAYWTGHHSAEMIMPYWAEVNRLYYRRGSKGLSDGATYADQGSWDKAAEKWLSEVNARNSKVSSRAAYNMALVSEMNDLLELAVEWVNRSLEIKASYAATQYLIVLEERLEIKNNLNNRQ
jgi:hypothetical protein